MKDDDDIDVSKGSLLSSNTVKRTAVTKSVQGTGN